MTRRVRRRPAPGGTPAHSTPPYPRRGGRAPRHTRPSSPPVQHLPRLYRVSGVAAALFERLVDVAAARHAVRVELCPAPGHSVCDRCAATGWHAHGTRAGATGWHALAGMYTHAHAHTHPHAHARARLAHDRACSAASAPTGRLSRAPPPSRSENGASRPPSLPPPITPRAFCPCPACHRPGTSRLPPHYPPSLPPPGWPRVPFPRHLASVQPGIERVYARAVGECRSRACLAKSTCKLSRTAVSRCAAVLGIGAGMVLSRARPMPSPGRSQGDVERAAQQLLKDFRTGRLGRVCLELPPEAE